MEPPVAFNPRPRIERVPLSGGQSCFVVDDALLDPERLAAFAARQREAFQPVDFNAYPGVLLPTPQVSVVLDEFFRQHVRRLFDARRVLHMHSRLALVTVPPHTLSARQALCHRDSVGLDPQHSIQASVLYLFKDASMGGTSFYQPTVTEREVALLFHDASTLPEEAFAQKYMLEPGYMIDSNRYFTKVASVPAKWNRLIFYDGSLLHSGDIRAPERLSADPSVGRLTLNGFFTCRRRAA
ncbi:MAG TPA: DUF6445 family protein [Rudaea sp.]|nr:DUF6445 family protein [Rudaea sp.]